MAHRSRIRRGVRRRLRLLPLLVVFLAGLGIGLAYWLNQRPSRPIDLGRASSANTLPAGQCTWYAFDRVRDFGWQIGFTQSYGRHAKEWPKLVAGARLSLAPKVGAVMVLGPWAGNPYGHVAVVESVSGSDRWTISHANMMAGDDFARLDGYTVRRAECVLGPDGVRIAGGGPLPLLGFLAPL